MSSITSRLEILRSKGPLEVAALVARKFIYRKTTMGRYGVRAGDSQAPPRPHDLQIELWGPDRFAEVLPTNPHLHAEDVEHFRRQETVCIVALDGSRIASSTWMTKGDVFVHELERKIHVPGDEHFSCRSYVDPDYRGRSLLSHMIHAYAVSVSADDELWGLVYDWNVASARSLENLGWRLSGEYWTRVVLTRRFPGERRFPARGRTVDARPGR